MPEQQNDINTQKNKKDSELTLQRFSSKDTVLHVIGLLLLLGINSQKYCI